MKPTKPILATVLDKRRKLNSGRYPIKIKVTFIIFKEGKKKWVTHYYGTNLEATPNEFNIICAKTDPRSPELRAVRDSLTPLEDKARKILDDNRYVTIKVFEQRYFESGNLETVSDIFERKTKRLFLKDKIASSELYESARKSLTDYGGVDLTFADITPEWLDGYQEQKLKDGLAIGSIGLYTRNLRAIFNEAIEELKLVSRDIYPFGKKPKYTPPSSTKRKSAVKKDNKDVLLTYKTTNLNHREAVDYWIFSYYCYGMNMTDMSMLRKPNLTEDSIIIIRQKTINTESHQREIVIPRRKEIDDIISRWGIKSLDPNAYIFKFLKEGLSAKQRKYMIRDHIKNNNKYLKEVGGLLGITIKLTGGTARHTFATTLRNAGIKTNIIQQFMDHQSEKTTEIYFGDIDMEEKIKIGDLLPPQAAV